MRAKLLLAFALVLLLITIDFNEAKRRKKKNKKDNAHMDITLDKESGKHHSGKHHSKAPSEHKKGGKAHAGKGGDITAIATKYLGKLEKIMEMIKEFHFAVVYPVIAKLSGRKDLGKINFGDKQVKKYGKKLAALFYGKKKSKKNYKTQATVNRSIEKKAVSAGKKLFKAAVATLENCPCKKYPQSELVKIPKPLQEKLRKATEAVQVGAGEMNFFVQKIKCIRQHGKNCNMANTAKEHYQRNGPMDLQKGIDGGIGGKGGNAGGMGGAGGNPGQSGKHQ
ncbi:hypothetical protein DdX_11532 [Ditylenchus destructor]|uniref:Uncharacterized protein n=1 Tax=Ditylenchus destructor TaxID=166010 RepID=A0AAD4MWU3_9BILA|nr:hypothetical protein DdX_11532 [Ditylenchus destructor]